MRKAGIVLAGILVLPSAVAWAQNKAATPQEVVQRANQAARYLAKEKQAGLAVFNQKQSDYVWADTYVFVTDCQQKKIAAHPLVASLIGQDIAGIKDKAGK